MTDRSTRLLIVAAATAVVTVSTAAIVWNNRVVEARAAGPATWTVSAAEVHGGEHAVFLDPRSYWFSDDAGFIAAGDTVVTMAGLRNYETGQLEDVALAGLASNDGTVRWRTPITGTADCTTAVVDGKLLCQTHNAETWETTLLTVDTDTGRTTESPTDWRVYAIVAADDAIYLLEGDPEADDLRLHKGTPDDPDESWTTTVDMGDAYENIYGSRLLRVADGAVVLDVGGESTGFDIDTGAQTWTRSLPDCGESLDPSLGGVVTRIRRDCSLSRILSSELVAADGEVLARTDVAVAHYLDLDRPADPEVPVLLGDSAYDRATGAKLWSSADLVSAPIVPGSGRTAPNDTFGTASAIVGDVALLRDSVRQTEGGLDLRTGRRLWERPITAGQRIAAAVGTVAVSAYDNALIGLDVRTGDEVWRIALDAFVSTDDPFATSGTVGEADDRVLFMTKDRLGGFRTP